MLHPLPFHVIYITMELLVAYIQLESFSETFRILFTLTQATRQPLEIIMILYSTNTAWIFQIIFALGENDNPTTLFHGLFINKPSKWSVSLFLVFHLESDTRKEEQINTERESTLHYLMAAYWYDHGERQRQKHITYRWVMIYLWQVENNCHWWGYTL